MTMEQYQTYMVLISLVLFKVIFIFCQSYISFNVKVQHHIHPFVIVHSSVSDCEHECNTRNMCTAWNYQRRFNRCEIFLTNITASKYNALGYVSWRRYNEVLFVFNIMLLCICLISNRIIKN